MNDSPVGNASRLYVETLNEMIDAHTTRVAALANRIPDSVMYLQIGVAALAFGVLALYLAMLGRAVLPHWSAHSSSRSCCSSSSTSIGRTADSSPFRPLRSAPNAPP